MKKISTLLLVGSLLLGLSTSSFAQKYGHLNLGNLLSTLPASKTADAELAAMQEKIKAESQAKQEAFQKKYMDALESIQKGMLTPIQVQEKEKELEKERSELAKKEQDSLQKLQKKRQELLEPILKKVEDAINAVAKENGYVMIFDTSMFNSILFAQDSDDVIDLVKAKLDNM